MISFDVPRSIDKPEDSELVDKGELPKRKVPKRKESAKIVEIPEHDGTAFDSVTENHEDKQNAYDRAQMEREIEAKIKGKIERDTIANMTAQIEKDCLIRLKPQVEAEVRAEVEAQKRNDRDANAAERTSNAAERTSNAATEPTTKTHVLNVKIYISRKKLTDLRPVQKLYQLFYNMIFHMFQT